jgi:hypothetical protein
MVLSFMFSN